ncbi:MAG: hypothetical protein O2817_13245, partial [Proteobacteria bacterium]|nr:hypothetical protein [Pseudomonadota bacterium]
SQRTVTSLALIGAGLGIVLMVIRGLYALSFIEPLQLLTSGAEYESLYAIWKHVHGLTVYADHTRIPFAGSFYNWFYYVFYGEITKAVLSVLSLNDAWLPTITRLITATGMVYGTWITARLFLEFPGAGDDNLKRLGLAFAVLIFFGPMMGFFGIATQPDIWGFAFDVTSIYLFLRFYERQPLIGICLFWLFAYLAWSFKQIFVFSTGTVGLFLLLRRDWKMLGTLIILSVLAWGATLAIGTPQYVKNIVTFGGVTVSLAWSQLFRNLGNAGIKFLPLLLGLAGIGVAMARSNRRLGLIGDAVSSITSKTPDTHFGLALLGSIVTSILVIPASAKLGAAENYYFLLSFFLSLLLLSALAKISKNGAWQVTVSLPLSIGWLLHGLAVCLVLGGATGILSTRPQHVSMSSVSKCLMKKKLPGSVFIGHTYLSLPWMVPAEHHFVVQTNYRWDKPGGVEMEGGGIGGLIDQGYFATIVINGDTFDDSDLRRYRMRNEKCGSFNIFDRIDQ